MTFVCIPANSWQHFSPYIHTDIVIDLRVCIWVQVSLHHMYVCSYTHVKLHIFFSRTYHIHLYLLSICLDMCQYHNASMYVYVYVWTHCVYSYRQMYTCVNRVHSYIRIYVYIFVRVCVRVFVCVCLFSGARFVCVCVCVRVCGRTCVPVRLCSVRTCVHMRVRAIVLCDVFELVCVFVCVCVCYNSALWPLPPALVSPATKCPWTQSAAVRHWHESAYERDPVTTEKV